MLIRTPWVRLAQGIVALNALFFVGTGAVILLDAPLFHALVHFQPFNRHYLGDAGIFQFALGLGLLWALPAPAMRVAHIWIATIASFMHTANHLYDTLFASTPAVFAGWVAQTIVLLILAVSLLPVAIRCSTGASMSEQRRS
jgi:uncharacterized membrane protein